MNTGEWCRETTHEEAEAAPPQTGEYVVRKDDDGLGVIYLGPEFIGYHVVIVPKKKSMQPWAKEARSEK